MVRHGDAPKEEVYDMLRSNEVRRRLAFDLLEASNPELRENKADFLAVVRFIWDATVSYDVCREFVMRHSKMLIEIQRDILRAEAKRQHQQQSIPAGPGFFERLLQHP